jgi:hypothetical protein
MTCNSRNRDVSIKSLGMCKLKVGGLVMHLTRRNLLNLCCCRLMVGINNRCSLVGVDA